MLLGPWLKLRVCSLKVLVSCIMLVLIYGSETMIWKEKGRSRIRAVQIDNLTGLLSIRRMDKVPNIQIRELCGMMKGLMRVFSVVRPW